MVWLIIGHLFATLLAWVRMGRLSEAEKDLELLVMRQQLVMLERHLHKPVHPSRIEKLTLAVLVAKLKAITNRLAAGMRDSLRLFQPDTVLKWHPELVRRKRIR